MHLYLDLQYQNPEAVPGSGSYPAKYAYIVGSPSATTRGQNPNSVIGPRSLSLLKALLPPEVLESLYITSLTKIPLEPGKKKIPKRVVRQAAPDLFEELKAVGCKRILVSGAELAGLLCPGFKEIPEDHGALFQNPTLDALVVPTYRFSSAFDPQSRSAIQRDLWRWVNLDVPEPPPYRIITGTEQVQWKPKTPYVIDIETTGFDSRSDQILSIGFKSWKDTCVYIWEKPTPADLTLLYREFKQHATELVGHNLQFDLEWLMELTGFFWAIPVEDTMLMAHNSGEESLGLKHLTTMYTNRPGSHAFGGFADTGYLAEDVLSTQEVFKAFSKIRKTAIHQLVNRVIPVAAELKWQGVPLDAKLLQTIKTQQVKVLEQTKCDLNSLLPPKLRGSVNWNSPDQVVMALQKSRVPLTEKTDRGAYTVKESVLLQLKEKYPIVAKLLEFREQDKLMEFLVTYSEKMKLEMAQKKTVRPRLHPRLKIHGTSTGRTSMEDPNLQQVTRTGPLKTMFISGFEDGFIGLVDLSQAELRSACLLSGDPVFMEALLSEDVHKTIASMLYQIPREEISAYQRKKSKGITFGLLYGGGAAGLASRLGIDPAEVERVLEVFYGKFHILARYIKTTKSRAIQERQIVDHFGRVRNLNTLIELEGPRSAKRKAINTPIQGLASHMALLIMSYCFYAFRKARLQSRVLFGVHDSTLIDIHPQEINQVAEVVQEAFEALNDTPLQTLSLWGQLPIMGELIIGKSWAAVESTNEGYAPLSLLPVSSHPETGSGGREHVKIAIAA